MSVDKRNKVFQFVSERGILPDDFKNDKGEYDKGMFFANLDNEEWRKNLWQVLSNDPNNSVGDYDYFNEQMTDDNKLRYSVGDKKFRTREEAQAYADQNKANYEARKKVEQGGGMTQQTAADMNGGDFGGGKKTVKTKVEQPRTAADAEVPASVVEGEGTQQTAANMNGDNNGGANGTNGGNGGNGGNGVNGGNGAAKKSQDEQFLENYEQMQIASRSAKNRRQSFFELMKKAGYVDKNDFNNPGKFFADIDNPEKRKKLFELLKKDDRFNFGEWEYKDFDATLTDPERMRYKVNGSQYFTKEDAENAVAERKKRKANDPYKRYEELVSLVDKLKKERKGILLNNPNIEREKGYFKELEDKLSDAQKEMKLLDDEYHFKPIDDLNNPEFANVALGRAMQKAKDDALMKRVKEIDMRVHGADFVAKKEEKGGYNVEEKFAPTMSEILADYQSQLEDVNKKLSEEMGKEMAGRTMNGVMVVNPGNEMPTFSPYADVSPLATRKHMLEQAIQAINDGVYTRDSGDGGGGFTADTWLGLKRGLLKKDNLTFGMFSAIDAVNLYTAAERYKDGRATDGDIDLLNASAQNAFAQQYLDDNSGYGYSTGLITGEMIPFMVEMGINPIAITEGKLFEKGVIGTASKKTADWISRYAAKVLGKTVGKGVGVGIAGAGELLARGTGMALTTGLNYTIGDYLNRRAGNVQYDYNENGVEFDGINGGEDIASSIYKAVLSQAFERTTEMSGALGAKALGKLIGKTPLGKLAAKFNSWSPEGWRKCVKGIMKDVNWDGPFMEYFEEVENNILNATFIGDMNWGSGDNGVFNLEQNIKTFLGVALTGTMFLIAQAGEATSSYVKYKKAAEDLSSANLLNPLNNAIKDVPIDEIPKVLETFITENKLTSYGAKRACQYVRYKLALEYEEANKSASNVEKGVEAVDSMVEEERSGQSETQQESQNPMSMIGISYNESEKSINELEPICKTMVDDLISGNISPNEYKNFLQSLSPEEQKIMEDYKNACQKMSGVMEGINERVAEYRARITEWLRRQLSGSELLEELPENYYMATIDGQRQYLINYNPDSDRVYYRDGEGNVVEVQKENVEDITEFNTQERIDYWTEIEREYDIERAEFSLQYPHVPSHYRYLTTAEEYGKGTVVPTLNGYMMLMRKDEEGNYVLKMVETEEDGDATNFNPVGEDIVMSKEQLYDTLEEYYAKKEAEDNVEENAVEGGADAQVGEEETNGQVEGTKNGEGTDVQVEGTQNGEGTQQTAADMNGDVVGGENGGVVVGGENGDVVGGENGGVTTMPMDENGEPLYADAGAERSAAFIYGESGLEEDDADLLIENKIKKAKDELKKAKKDKPNATTIVEMKAERAAINERKAAAEQELALWESIKEARKTQVEEERKAQIEAEKMAQMEADNAAAIEAEKEAAKVEEETVAEEENNNGEESADISAETEQDNNQTNIKDGKDNSGKESGNQPQSSGENGLLESASAAIRGHLEASGRKLTDRAGRRPQEETDAITQSAVEWAKRNGRLIPIEDLRKNNVASVSGTEHSLFVSPDGKRFLKMNNLAGETSSDILMALERMIMHNELFPQTAYEFEGLVLVDELSGLVLPLFSQNIVQHGQVSNEKQIEDYMKSIGFTKNGEGSYTDGKIVVSDLFPRNVLVDNEGNIYPIDADFKMAEGKSAEVSAETEQVVKQPKTAATVEEIVMGEKGKGKTVEEKIDEFYNRLKEVEEDEEKYVKVDREFQDYLSKLSDEDMEKAYDIYKSDKYNRGVVLLSILEEYDKKEREDRRFNKRMDDNKRRVDDALKKENKNADKMNLYDFAETDKKRPSMTGIYHDRGYEISTDGRCMIIVKKKYDKKLEGKITAKDGSIIEQRYPRWLSVLPNIESKDAIPVSLDDIKSALELIKAKIKEEGLKKKDYKYFTVNVGSMDAPTFISYELIDKFFKNLSKLGTDVNAYLVPSGELNILVFETDGVLGIVMPRSLYTNQWDFIASKDGIITGEEYFEYLRDNHLKIEDGFVVKKKNPSELSTAFDETMRNETEAQKLATDLVLDIAGDNIVKVTQEEGQRVRNNNDVQLMRDNERFNNELQKQIDNELPEGHIYEMGMPGSKLLACGVPNLPIQMSSSRLKEKSSNSGHDYQLSDVKNLVDAINNPIAVFRYGNNNDAINVIVNIEKDGKNFLVGIFLNPKVNGEYLEINSVRTLFPRNIQDWVLWIQQGKLLGGDAKKIQDSIDKQRSNFADVNYIDLNSVAKVLNNGEYVDFSSIDFSKNYENLTETHEFSIVDDKKIHDILENGVELSTSDGKVYGYSYKGKIYLTPEGINPNTPIHEYTHIWAEAVRKNNPKGWADIVSLLKDTPIWDAVKSDENYKGLKTDDAIASEVLSRISGKENAKKFVDAAEEEIKNTKDADDKVKKENILNRIKEALNKFWKFVSEDLFKMRFTSIDEVTNRVLYDFINKTELNRNAAYADAVTYDDEGNLIPLSERFNTDDEDIRYRGINEFKDGQVLKVKEDELGGEYSVEGLGGRYSSRERLLEQFRRKYGDYIARLNEDGDIVIERIDKEPQQPKSKKQTVQDIVFASREVKRMVDAVEKMAEKLGVNVNVVKTKDGLEGKDKKAKGWYDPRTGEITIVVPNNRNVDDVMRTLLHEAVAHHGLRELFGANFDTFLDNVFNNLPTDIREQIMRNAIEKYGMNRRKATEEYLASIAEDMDFERAGMQSWWGKVKIFFLEMLEKAGLKIRGGLSDADIRSILWRSYDNLKNRGGRVKYAPGERSYKSQGFEYTYDDALVFPKESVSDEETRLYREGGLSENPNDPTEAASYYEKFMNATSYTYNAIVQDSMLAVKNLQDAIEKATGKAISGFENAYIRENRLSSVSYVDMVRYEHDFFLPLMDAAKNLFGKKRVLGVFNKRKLTADERTELKRYMFSKHGLERNEVFAMRDAIKEAREKADYDAKTKELSVMLASNAITQEEYDKQIEMLEKGILETANQLLDKYRKKDYSGLTALFGIDANEENAVAKAEAMAHALVSEFEDAREGTVIGDFWNKVNAATQNILDKQYECGMVTEEQYKRASSMFDYYVPLRGFAEETAEDVYNYINSSSNTSYQAPIKEAKSRSSEADDPFAYIISMAMSGILSGNRNLLVKQALYNLAVSHKTPLLSVGKVYARLDEVSGEYKDITPEIPANATAEQANRIIDEFEKKMEKLVVEKPEEYVCVTDNPHIPYRVTSKSDLNQHQVTVKRGGKIYTVTVNGNPAAAQAINGMFQNSKFEVQIFKKFLRFLSQGFTTRNPEFVLRNLFRDAIYSMSMVSVKENARYARAYKNNWFKSWWKLIGSMLRYHNGKLDENSKWDRMYKQFVENGGETGYAYLESLKDYSNKISKKLGNKRVFPITFSDVIDCWDKIISPFNQHAETVSRYAAFVTSMEEGRGIDKSIYDAKEVSVNFNKKGAGSAVIGENNSSVQKYTADIADFVRNNFVFANAGIQGLKNFFSNIYNNPKKGSVAISVLFSLGFVMPFLNGALQSLFASIADAAGGDDDKDKDKYENIFKLINDKYNLLPEYQRRNNINVYIGNDMFLSIPLTPEFRSFYGLGEIMSSYLLNGEQNENGLARAIAGQFSQMLPVDILEGGEGGTSCGRLVPSYIKPFYEISENKAWNGYPIWREANGYNDKRRFDPEWTKDYEYNKDALTSAAKYINEISGGDDEKKGAVDLNPAKVRYLINSIFGGLTKTPFKVVKFVSMPFDEDARTYRNIPVISGILASSNEKEAKKSINKEYHQTTENVDEYMKHFKGYNERANDTTKTEEYRKEYAEKFDALRNDSLQMRKCAIIGDIESIVSKCKKSGAEVAEFKYKDAANAVYDAQSNEEIDSILSQLSKTVEQIYDEANKKK